MSGVI